MYLLAYDIGSSSVKTSLVKIATGNVTVSGFTIKPKWRLQLFKFKSNDSPKEASIFSFN